MLLTSTSPAASKPPMAVDPGRMNPVGKLDATITGVGPVSGTLLAGPPSGTYASVEDAIAGAHAAAAKFSTQPGAIAPFEMNQAHGVLKADDAFSIAPVSFQEGEGPVTALALDGKLRVPELGKDIAANVVTVDRLAASSALQALVGVEAVVMP